MDCCTLEGKKVEVPDTMPTFLHLVEFMLLICSQVINTTGQSWRLKGWKQERKRGNTSTMKKAITFDFCDVRVTECSFVDFNINGEWIWCRREK